MQHALGFVDDEKWGGLMTNTTINLVRYDGNGKGNGGAGVMGRLVGQATCMVST
jgi:hypothetical protein